MGKAKHPGKYDNFTDAELGRMMKRAQPGKYEQYTDEALEVRSTDSAFKPSNKLIEPIEAISSYSPPSYERPSTEDHLKELWAYYNPHKGRLSSWWRKGQTKSRTELVGLLNEEQVSVIRMGAVLAEQVRQGQRTEIEFQMFLAQNIATLNQLMHNQHLSAIAMDEGLSTTVSQALKQKRIEMEIDVERHKKMKDVDIQAEFDQAMNTLAAISKFKHLQYEQFDEIRGRILSLIEEEARIENSNVSPQVKGEQLSLIAETKQMYREILDVERRRLLETGNGQEAEGIGSITDLISGRSTSRATATEPISVAKSGNSE
jgi:hypothetical protein